MTEKTERVAVYVTEQTKTAIEQEANSKDVSQAEWIRSLIHRELKNEQQERITKTTNAEQRIESLIAEARDATEEVAEEIESELQQYHDLLARNAVYSTAAFRLIGDANYTDPQRKQALIDARNRTVESDVPDGVRAAADAAAADATADNGNDTRASGSRAQDQQGQQPQQPDPNGGDGDADGGVDVDDILDS